ncbi:hypothetical protein [Kordia jejudonensis]|uniref:hypothetical protein n=1 Tax=Kordia jejudonensis TaxID=1348245 RepID=UPI00062901EA|nr:hypothetical protein [Kordia jejudonensis]
MSSPLIVPGTKISEEKIDDSTIYYDVNKNDSTIKLNLNLPTNDVNLELSTLVPATCFAFHHDTTHLKVKSFCFVRRNREVEETSFELTYQVTFNPLGSYQLNIYIQFTPNSTPTDLDSNMYNCFEFDIVFPSDSIKLDDKSLDLIDFDSVEVFLIRTNPKTSRGTVTTVQRPG